MAQTPTKSVIPIIHFIIELSVGGAQMSLYRLLKELDRCRFSPIVACLYNGKGLVGEEIRKLGISVVELNMQNIYRLDAFARLSVLLRQNQPAILHTWMFHANISGRILGRMMGVPVIISSERTMGQESSFRQKVNRITAPLCNVITCVSENVANYAVETIGLKQDKIEIIPNGIDLNHYRKIPSQKQIRDNHNFPTDGLIIGAIGRPRPVKGYEYLLQAYVKMVKELPKVYLSFVGSGPDQYKLIQEAKNFGLNDRISIFSDRVDIPDMLKAMDVLVSSSWYEGMPNVVLEAMAARLPVVATNVGGTPEVVVDGETGFLVPPGDPEALANAIQRLIDDPELRKKFGQAGRKRVEKHFTIQETVRKTEALYLRLLAEKGIEV